LDNIHSGIAAIQKVDASLTTIASYLTEMRTLAVSAASAKSSLASSAAYALTCCQSG
jgi:flagellin-like hook-associated protein FlgL